MKRKEFIRELEKAGCVLHRHGAKHDIYRNLVTGSKTPVPPHSEVKDSSCCLIRQQLDLT